MAGPPRHVWRQAWRRFAEDARGGTVVDFVLWLPFFAFWLSFSVALYDLYMTRNQAAKTAHTLVDIVSRQETMTADLFTDLALLRQGLLTRATGETRYRLSAIQRTGDGHVVVWSCSATASLPALTDAAIPLEALPVMAPLETVVLTELVVPWDRFAGVGPLTGHEWAFRLAVRPRFTPQLALSGTC